MKFVGRKFEGEEIRRGMIKEMTAALSNNGAALSLLWGGFVVKVTTGVPLQLGISALNQ